MDVHTFINLWWLAVVWKWYVLFEVIPNESLDFKPSLTSKDIYLLTNASAARKSLISPVQTPTVSVSVKISK